MRSRGDEPPRDPLVRPVKFELGQLVATPGVTESVPHFELSRALRRHASGDWGELDVEDLRANEVALVHGARLLSAYTTRAGIKFWIITEANRASTTALLPSEY